MKIVVTGATGLTAAAVVHELVQRGHEVVGTTRRMENLTRIRDLGAAGEVADPNDPSSLGSLTLRTDALIHVAGIRSGTAVARANIDRLRRVIVMSTAAIHSRSHPSAAVYRQGEEAITRANPRTLFVRPTMIYGSASDRNVHRVIAFARRFRFLPVPDRGHSLIQPIHYADLARAVVLLFETTASGAVDVGGPRSLTLLSAARAIFAALRMRALLLPMPVPLVLPIARAVDSVARSQITEKLQRAREDRVVDNSRLFSLADIHLRPFEDGVREEVRDIERGRVR